MPGDNPEPPPPDALPTTEATDEEIERRSAELHADRPSGHGDIESRGFDPDVYRAERIAGVRPPSPWPRHRGTPGLRRPGDPPGETPPAPDRPGREFERNEPVAMAIGIHGKARLVGFLYILARDHLPTGSIESILRDHVVGITRHGVTHSSPALEQLAAEWAFEILDGKPKQRREPT